MLALGRGPQVGAGEEGGEHQPRHQPHPHHPKHPHVTSHMSRYNQGGSDGSGRHSAAPMLTAIMSGGVGISGRELSLSC